MSGLCQLIITLTSGGILRHYTLKGGADPEAVACNNMILMWIYFQWTATAVSSTGTLSSSISIRTTASVDTKAYNKSEIFIG